MQRKTSRHQPKASREQPSASRESRKASREQRKASREQRKGGTARVRRSRPHGRRLRNGRGLRSWDRASRLRTSGVTARNLRRLACRPRRQVYASGVTHTSGLRHGSVEHVADQRQRVTVARRSVTRVGEASCARWTVSQTGWRASRREQNPWACCRNRQGLRQEASGHARKSST